MSDLNDVVAVGLDLKPSTLLHAYAQGVFPWPTEGLPLLWYCPKQRAILAFDSLHVSKRLKQYLQKSEFRFTTDQAFEAVISACGERGEEGTWISAEMKAAYIALHRLGHAHSVEVWLEQELVGGIYGVDTAGYFAGESMFHRVDHASKAALLYAVALQKKVGREFMDIQVMSPHLLAMGATEITRTVFKKKLARAREVIKLLGPSQPFLERESCGYGDFSRFIE